MPPSQKARFRDRSTDVVSSPRSHSREDSTEKLLNAKRAATFREEEGESSVAEADQCEQSADISCSANSKNY